MIGMIRPLVEAPSKRTGFAVAAMVFGSTALLAANSVGLVVAWAAHLSHALMPTNAADGLLALICLALAFGDFGLFRLSTPTVRRQTASYLWRLLGIRAWAAWGFDLGLGFSTIRVTSLYWVVLAGSLLGIVDLSGSIVVFSCYALGLSVAIWAWGWRFYAGGPSALAEVFFGAAGRANIRAFSGGILIAASALLLVGALRT